MDILVKYTAVVLGGALFAFGAEWLQLGCLLLFFVSGYLSKKDTVCTVVLYHVVILLPIGVAAYDYSESAGYATLAFTVPFIINVAVLSLALVAKPVVRPFLTVIALIVLAIPPLAAYSIVSPIPLAGLLFPGFQELGIALFLVITGALTIAKTISKYLPVLVGLTLAQSSAASINGYTIEGINTNDGISTPLEQITEYQLDRYTQLDIAEDADADIVVFPEGALGEWSDETRRIFKNSSVTIYGGTRLRINESAYTNALINATTGEVIYRQEKPIAIQQSGRHQAIPGTNEENDYPGVLICNEIVNPWRAYDVFGSNKQAVIWIANTGWTDKSFVSDRLADNARHWARLFGKHLIVAVNRHG